MMLRLLLDLQKEDIMINLFSELGLFYIHIPKTGGNTVLRTLRRQVKSNRDMTNKEVIEKFIEIDKKILFTTHSIIPRHRLDVLKNEGITSFSTVRNPYDRAYSCYHWSLYYTGKKFEGTFLDWLNNKEYRHRYGYLFQPQTAWLFDDIGQLPVKTCKLENLNHEMKKLCNKNTFQVSDNDFQFKLNKNPNRKEYNLHNIYDSKSKQKVIEIYRDDFINFDYNMNIL